uniref:Ion-translocating oxidoreductase complex subunit C n=1 Tax=Halobacteroides sp. TB21 TaxID=1504410 RepID=A0A060DAC0_9FIRM|nr:electron transport complex protein RnfC [Halobacteroides sp. TB21]
MWRLNNKVIERGEKMEAQTFQQGIHPSYNKELTNQKSLQRAEEPSAVMIPIQQHIGAPAQLIVEVGDEVAVGEKIAEAGGFVSANIHASIAGEVTAIEEKNEQVVVKIENDGSNQQKSDLESHDDLAEVTPAEVRNIIQEAGIVGLGGATFPSHVKVSIPDDKNVDTVMLNGAECEPYLTVDHRMMLEMGEQVLFGLKALMKAADAEQGYIGIEMNKLDAIENMKEITSDDPNIEVVPLEVKYPQGGEKQLIEAILDKEVPSGGLPLDIGIVVNNIGTAVAITEAIKDGKSLFERAVTVTGAVNNPQNLIVKVGTPIKELIEQCDGFKGQPGKVIMGGPMTGQAQNRLDNPVTKGTSGVLVLNEEEAKDYSEAGPCIRCASCVDVCPMNLVPTRLVNLVKEDMIEEAEEDNLMDCIECGSCSYVCPSNIELVQRIKLGKEKVRAKKREQ